jgi:hypothetical protein
VQNRKEHSDQGELAVNGSICRTVYTKIGAAEVVLNIDRAAQAITALHLRFLLTQAHSAIRSVAQVVLLKGRTARTYAFRHSVFVKRDFHGIRLQIFNVRRLLRPFFVLPNVTDPAVKCQNGQTRLTASGEWHR